MAVSKRLRYEILRRDNHTCQYCGRRAPEVRLTVDHVVPKVLGGSDDPTNLLTACSDCNGGKTSSNPDAPLVAAVDQRAAHWAQALEIAIARRQEALEQERVRIDAFDRAWRAWPEMPRESGWRASVSRFLANGLDDRYLAEAVETAMGARHVRSNDVWKYFCGICWREIDKIQESARESMPKPVATDDDEVDELAAGFPYMETFSMFLEDVMRALKADDRAVRILRQELWDVMARADQVWQTKSFGTSEEDAEWAAAWEANDDGWHGGEWTRWDMVAEFVPSYCAHSMYRVGQIVAEGQESRDGS